jgi:hypothetical protein
MGTDFLRLFNKSLADQIIEMNQQELARYVEQNLDTLKEIDKSHVLLNSILFVVKQDGVSVNEAIKRLLKEQPLREIKAYVALDLAYGEEWIYLDYWGCYAHVFSEGDPKGSVSCRKYLPDDSDCSFLLLKPEHIDRIIKSLKEHIDDLPVMEKEGVARVEYFRDFCRNHTDYWVSYQFDF